MKRQNLNQTKPNNLLERYNISPKATIKPTITMVKVNTKVIEEVTSIKEVDILRVVEETEVVILNKDKTIILKVMKEITEEDYIRVKVIHMVRDTQIISKVITNSSITMRAKKKVDTIMSISLREEVEEEEVAMSRKTMATKMWTINLTTIMIPDLKVKFMHFNQSNSF